MNRSRLSPRLHWPSGLVVVLALLALWDLRIEIQLLFEHFTITALREAIWAHPLAVAVLVLLPQLQQRSSR